MSTFDLDQLPKLKITKIAHLLGHKADWARVSKEDAIDIVNGCEASDVVNAMREIGFTDLEIDDLKMGEGTTSIPSAKEALSAMDDETVNVPPLEGMASSKPVAKVKPSQAPTDADQVSQIAALLAQVLATNKGALDTDAVMELINGRVEEHSQVVTNQLQSVVEAVADMIKKIEEGSARKIEVTSNNGTYVVEGRQHKQFEQLLKTISCRRLNVWIAGQAGTGKTTAAHNCAIALGLNFYTNGAINEDYKLTGFIDAAGKLHRTPFRDAWELGGVYLFDEVDASDANVVLSFNAALANGIMAFPDGMIERHPDCRIIAAANTMGEGATAEYVGRMKQDKAFFDRFVTIYWQLDEELESHFTENKGWASYVQSIRRKVSAKGLKVLVTPRATVFGAELLANGMDRNTVIQMCIRKSMTDAQWDMVS